MARRGEDVFRLSLRGAGRTAANLDRAGRDLQDIIVSELRQLGLEVEFAFQTAAPHDTEDLSEAIQAIASFKTIRPRVRVAVGRLSGHEGDSRDSFDYLETTRRGHRKRIIHPVRRRALKVHYAGHRNAAIYDFASFVPGALPNRDWVEEGDEFSEPAIDRMERRVGRRIDRSLRGI